jgi:hypothetical protein
MAAAVMRRAMCTAPAVATMRSRMATTWIIASPAIFTTRTATTATITAHWFLPSVEPHLPDGEGDRRDRARPAFDVPPRRQGGPRHRRRQRHRAGDSRRTGRSPPAEWRPSPSNPTSPTRPRLNASSTRSRPGIAARHPGQQCGHRHPPPCCRAAALRLGQGGGRQPDRRLPVLPGGGA